MTSPREQVAAILADRWSLDEQDGWDEFGEATLDEIEAAFQTPTRLIQVGSQIWLHPNAIKGVRWIPPSTSAALGERPGYTQIMHGNYSLTSDWPIERVQAALGLRGVK